MLPLPFTFVESVWLPKNLPCSSSMPIDPPPRASMPARELAEVRSKSPLNRSGENIALRHST